jgi:hypothetical protein
MRPSRNAAEERNAASSRPLFRYLKTPHREVEAEESPLLVVYGQSFRR